MKHRRINVTKRHATSNVVSRGVPVLPAPLHLPSETPHERNKLIKIRSASPADYRAGHDNKEPERVLLPLHIPVQFATASEEPILHDPHGRKELEWHGKQNRERIQELYGLRKSRRRVKILQDDSIDIRSKGKIGQCAGTTEEDWNRSFRMISNGVRSNSPRRKIMTPESTIGNLCGSRMESVIGMTYKTCKGFTLPNKHVISPSLFLRRRIPLCYKWYLMRGRTHGCSTQLLTQSAAGSPSG